MEFNINYNTWKIIQKSKDELLEKYNNEYDDEARYAFGVTIFPDHEIWINKDMCLESQITTLKHELTHCYIWSYGLFNIPNYTEEMLCDLVASTNDFVNDIIEKYFQLK